MKNVGKVYKASLFGLFAVMLGFAATSADALVIKTFSGQDLNPTPAAALALHPNSDQARNDFEQALALFGTETFDGLKAGDGGAIAGARPPIPLHFGSVTSGVADGLTSGNVLEVRFPVTGGRFPTSGANYVRWGGLGTKTDKFDVTFKEPVDGFGFYGIDIGDDRAEQLSLNVTFADSSTRDIDVLTTTSSTLDGSVLYFGFVADGGIKRLTLKASTTRTGDPIMGFDDFTAGRVPEPGTLTLVLAGWLAARKVRRAR